MKLLTDQGMVLGYVVMSLQPFSEPVLGSTVEEPAARGKPDAHGGAATCGGEAAALGGSSPADDLSVSVLQGPKTLKKVALKFLTQFSLIRT